MPHPPADDGADTDARLDELFAIEPAEFVARRDDWVRELRSAGDVDAAREVKALRRPTQSAWLVNLLVRERRDVVQQLLALGEALREAQTALDGATLKVLSAQRRSIVDALVRDAARLGAATGASVGAETRAEVGSTLDAALVDPDVAEQVRRGRLSRPASRTGFGAPDLAVVPSGAGTPSRRSLEGRQGEAENRREEDRRTGDQRRAQRERDRLLRAAEEADSARREAERAREVSVARHAAAQAAAQELAARLAQLREQIGDVERRLAEASLDERHRKRELAKADDALAAATRAAQRARDRATTE